MFSPCFTKIKRLKKRGIGRNSFPPAGIKLQNCALANFLPLESRLFYGESFGNDLQYYSSSAPSQSFKTLWELGGAPGGWVYESEDVLPWLWPPTVSHSHCSPHSTSCNSLKITLYEFLPFYGSTGFYLRYAALNWWYLYDFACFSIFQGGSLFNNLSSLIGQRTVIDSQFVQVFLL